MGCILSKKQKKLKLIITNKNYGTTLSKLIIPKDVTELHEKKIQDIFLFEYRKCSNYKNQNLSIYLLELSIDKNVIELHKKRRLEYEKKIRDIFLCEYRRCCNYKKTVF
jgi:hypothetical protein